MAKRLTERKKRRLLREVREMLEPFGLDLALYDEGEAFGNANDPHSYLIGVSVEFKRRDNDRVVIRVDNVIWHEDTGAVLQASRPLMLDYT
jgi:hypothetical protein